MIHTICYFSTAHPSLQQEELESLFIYSKENNQKKEVSGILVHADGNFMQVLEGDKKTINELYQKIAKDTRHSNIIKVPIVSYEHRIFEDYDYGFTIIDDRLNIEKLNKYLNWLSHYPSNEINRFVKLLQQFIKNT
ncbi:hypothetical protein GTQ40_00875 [Flavobacteriaceae bacterium R38]|nr:hypothetical protein [Flavobacteriaceae bacterium R38]